MIFKNSQQNIIIDVPLEYKNIGLKISGGADSAIVAYMLAKYIHESRRDLTIIPITVDFKGKAFQSIFAKKVLNFIKENFDVKIGKHQIRIHDNDNSTPNNDMYKKTQDNLMSMLYNSKIIDCHFVGITANPPKDVMESFNTQGPYDDRSPGQGHPIRQNKVWKPLINIDKKGVKELYETLGVLDTLFPITRSCERRTDDFSQHCGEYIEFEHQCWFCKERYWGFGKYE